MSYSNGKLPEDTISHDKIIEIVKGLPGVGFKLTDDGDYDIQNKKLTNVSEPHDNNDGSTKKYVDSEVSKTLKKDGTDQMNGLLNMNNSRIENVGAGRHGITDALTHLQLEAFYFDLNTDSGNIEAQNPIDMKNERILGVKDPILYSDASNKFYVDSSLNFKADKTELSNKADKTELANYLKKDGSVSVTGNFNFGDNKITRVGNGSNSTDVVNKGYIDTELFSKPNVNQVVLRDGTQDMTGNLNMSQKKIINCAPPSDVKDLSTKGYVDTEVAKKTNVNQVVLRDGTQDMTGNLNMNNFKITNVKDATNNQDVTTLKQVSDAIATTSTNNNKYTDQKLAESHITTHENRKNVLAYAMEDADEFSTDFGLQDVQFITYNDSPHINNKSTITVKVRKTTDGSSLFKGRFDFNLYTLTEKNFSNQYTICLEIIFPKDRRYDKEFNSTKLTFEKLNMNIDKFHAIKINHDYKYYRTILNLSPDGSSKLIQRRLYTTIECSYDNLSPNLLPLYVVIYGIKGEAKNDIDFTICDYEVANNQFQLHVPINMNNNKIMGLPGFFPSYIWGRTLRSSFRCEFQNPILSTLILDSIHIVSIKIFAQSTYSSSTNHVLIVQADKIATYDLNFSTNKTITVNMNRSYQNVNHIHIQFNDNVIKVFKFKIKYKTFSP